MTRPSPAASRSGNPSLLVDRRFAPLFWCQFFSAFNDNFLKNALVFLILWGIGGQGPGHQGLGGSSGPVLVSLAGAVFIAPFFLLSGLGGELADRFDKALLARRLKFAEIAAAALAVAGFGLHSVPVLFVALAGFGVISALFGPVKYAILPDQLPKERLNAANALVEFATFLAILAGTIGGGLAAAGGGSTLGFGILVMLFAVLSWQSASLIPSMPEAAPDLPVRANLFASTADLLRGLHADRKVWMASLITTWFWFAGSIALLLLPMLIKDRLGGDEGAATLALCAFSLGIGAGSGLAVWLTGGRIVLLPCALGSLGMAGFLLDLAFLAEGPALPMASLADFLHRSEAIHALIDLAGLAACGGLVAVPSFAAVQAWSGVERRARSVGGVNVLSAGAMALGALAVAGAQKAGAGESVLLAGLGLASLLAAFAMLRSLHGRVRDLLWMIFRLLYRVELTGQENMAKLAPHGVVVFNHVSWLDAALALSLLDRPPVFAVDATIAERWWVRPLLKLFTALPIDPTKPFGTRLLINAVRNGETLVIFPEGRITVTGSLMKVYDGAALIADKAEAEILPIRIDGLDASLFSRLSDRQVRRRWFPKVRVSVLEPVRLAIEPDLRGRKRRLAGGAALYDVMSDSVWRTADLDRTVYQALVQAARRHGFGQTAVEDPTSGRLSYRRLLAGAALLGRRLSAGSKPGDAVGLLLPNANAAAASFFGLSAAGRVPAMLNFTAGAANLTSACRTARLRTVVTSRTFVERARLEPVIAALRSEVRIVLLEDIAKEITKAERLRALLRTYFGARPLGTGRPDEAAAILFTSGSEGTPKGVVLSHRNILANTAQVAARIDFGREDKVFNVLPVFHSFGLTAGLILPLVYGVPVYLYPSPLHYRIVPELVYASNATILFGTDTFLTGYARTANAYDFRSLRYVVSGAEPVKPATRAVYLEKFGLRILEGYGVTETAPVLALNTPMFNRFGTVGRLLPGIDYRLEPVAGIEAKTGTKVGRLQVCGPNVMLGYLRAERPGVLEPLADGWYDTGDIVAVDAEGFVAIQGRAKRFAKIGGEMVSLAAVEALASDLWPEAKHVVVARPDPRKGERLVLLTEQAGAERARFLDHARNRGATELMMPSELRIVKALPLLGSGKIDFSAAAKLYEEEAAPA